MEKVLVQDINGVVVTDMSVMYKQDGESASPRY